MQPPNASRNLTPPGSKQPQTSGTYSVVDKSSHDSKLEDDEITSPGNTNFTLGQQFFTVFDNLSPPNQHLLIVFANAFAAMGDADKKILIAAAEKLAGL